MDMADPNLSKYSHPLKRNIIIWTISCSCRDVEIPYLKLGESACRLQETAWSEWRRSLTWHASSLRGRVRRRWSPPSAIQEQALSCSHRATMHDHAPMPAMGWHNAGIRLRRARSRFWILLFGTKKDQTERTNDPRKLRHHSPAKDVTFGWILRRITPEEELSVASGRWKEDLRPGLAGTRVSDFRWLANSIDGDGQI